MVLFVRLRENELETQPGIASDIARNTTVNCTGRIAEFNDATHRLNRSTETSDRSSIYDKNSRAIARLNQLASQTALSSSAGCSMDDFHPEQRTRQRFFSNSYNQSEVTGYAR